MTAPDERNRRLSFSAAASRSDQLGSKIKSEDRDFPTFSQAALIPRNSAADLRLQRLAQGLHELGERPLHEFLREILAGDVHIWEQLDTVGNTLVENGTKPTIGQGRELPFAFGSRLFRPPTPCS